MVAAKATGFIIDHAVYQVGEKPADDSGAPTSESSRLPVALGFCGGRATLTKIAERSAPTEFMGVTVSVAQVIYGLTDIPDFLRDPAVIQSMTDKPKDSYAGNVSFFKATDGWRLNPPLQIPGLGAPMTIHM